MAKTSNGLIVSFGEMLIDFVPTVSGVSLAEAPGFVKAPGGAPANVAIAVARLGGKAAFVGKLGDDEFGKMLAGILKENGVSADGVNFDKGARTALAFVTLRADGEREFMFYRNPSADMLLTPDELNLDIIRSVSIFTHTHTNTCVCVCACARARIDGYGNTYLCMKCTVFLAESEPIHTYVICVVLFVCFAELKF